MNDGVIVFRHLNSAHHETDPVVVIDDARHYRRSELLSIVARVKAGLDARPSARDAILVYGSHGCAAYAALIAALATSARVVLLDQATPLAPLAPVLRTLDVRTVLNASPLADVELAGADTLNVDSYFSGPSPTDAQPLELSCGEYVIFTSGTSGEPKAIVQSMAALDAHIRNYALYLGAAPGDRVLQLASCAWDAGLMDVFLCLLHGGVLCTINPRQHDLDAVRDFIDAHDIDTLHMTVPYFRRMYAERAAGPMARKLVIGGELIYGGDLERFNAAFPHDAELFNAYGPTECTVALYARHCNGPFAMERNWPLSRGVDGVTVALLDGGRVVTEPHAIGELVIMSDWVARRMNPASGAIEALTTVHDGLATPCYATGDLAYHAPQGGIVITGRNDSVIKVNGQKVSLHEVEAALRTTPGVRDVCVLTDDVQGEAAVLAAIVPAGAEWDPVAVRRNLAARLPLHKVPRHFLSLPALPLNKNNKVDRTVLRTLFRAEPSAAPSGHILLREVVASLGTASADDTLSYVDNGGDSLRALQVVASLKRQGYGLDLLALLSDTPLRALSLSAAPAGRKRVSARPLQRSAMPVKRFLETRGIPDLDAWCQSFVLEYRGAASVADATAQLNAVLERHCQSWSGWHPDARYPEHVSIEDAVRASEARISLVARTRLACAVARAEGVLHFIVSCHQFHVDRYSWILLLSELDQVAIRGVDALAAWDSPRYAEEWEAHYALRLASERDDAFWRALPWGRCASRAQATMPFPARDQFRRTAVRVASSDLPGFDGGLSVLGNALLASLMIALAEQSGNVTQKIHVLDHGRHLGGADFPVDGVFGWLTLIFPVVLEIDRAHPSAVLRNVEAYLARVKPFAHSFGNAFFGDPQTARGGLYDCDVSFNFLGDIEISSSSTWRVSPASMRTMHGAQSHHLEITGYRAAGDLHLSLDHDPAVFDAAEIDRLGRALLAALMQMAALAAADAT
ncbi:AMP-binding protein [Burkholderia sp. Bp8992]|uniref:AMP-binding protein n=1 Tax=Burkholderia sp. Bp8992 TaxID=2184554 RepID=UPI000F57A70C|nr:AMP-binding protein [Burkholderia sp. Bp8992]RQS26593.1 AMP-binding protein [Burkholderia sp. Bp8992]